MKKILLALVAFGLLAAQEKVDQAVGARFRSEELEKSQIMRTLHMLTDRYGPRVTGSPNHEAAANWVVKQLTDWGLKNAHLEPWEFGHPGWSNQRASAFIVSPVQENLKFEVLAWTPSTKGTVTASAIQLVPPQGPPRPPAAERTDATAAAGRGGPGGFPGRGGPARLGPTKAEMDEWVKANQSKVSGKVVLVGKAAVIPVNFDPPAKRRDDEMVKAQFAPNNTGGGRGGFGGRGGDTPDPDRLTPAQATEQIDAMLMAGGAVVRLNDAARGDGVIVAQQNRAYDPTKTVPTLILRNDDFGRVERLLADGEDVKMEFQIVNRDYPEGKTSYNVVGEIPGTDKADEIVMLGGHLDSWHAATGATDNAIGSAIMLEAVRLIQSMGLKPRRTVRVALWSGEEEGLLGSLAYVKQHFGTAENPRPEWAKLDCYFNVDTGTGRLRGAGIFGPPEAAAMLRPVLAQFTRLGSLRREQHQQPRHRRHRQHFVQQRRAAGRGVFPGPHRVQHADAPHQPRHLRAHYPGRRTKGGGDCGGGGVARGQSRRYGPAVHQGHHASSRGTAVAECCQISWGGLPGARRSLTRPSFARMAS
jgi:hypothetical protein